MTTNSELFTAIFTEVKTFAVANSLPVKYPGKKFNTPDSGNWLELSINPNDIDQTLSDQSNYRRGMVQFNIGGKPDSNSIDLINIAGLIAANFHKTKVLSGAVVVTNTPYQLNILELDDRVLLPVTFNYSE